MPETAEDKRIRHICEKKYRDKRYAEKGEEVKAYQREYSKRPETKAKRRARRRHGSTATNGRQSEGNRPETKEEKAFVQE